MGSFACDSLVTYDDAVEMCCDWLIDWLIDSLIDWLCLDVSVNREDVPCDNDVFAVDMTPTPAPAPVTADNDYDSGVSAVLQTVSVNFITV